MYMDTMAQKPIDQKEGNLQLAKELLIALPISLSEIAVRAGFSDAQSLTHTFNQDAFEDPLKFQARIRKRDKVPVYQHSRDDMDTQEQKNMIDAIAASIENRNTNLPEIAKSHGISVSTFRKLVHDAYGCTPVRLKARSLYNPQEDYTFLEKKNAQPASPEFKKSIMKGSGGIHSGYSPGCFTVGQGASWHGSGYSH